MPLFACGQSALDKAKVLYEANKYQAAGKILESVHENSKDFAAAQYYMGRIAFDTKAYDDAADHFREATESDPKVADYFSWLGDCYGVIAQNSNVLKQGYLAQKMKRAWEIAVRLDPKNLNARTSLVQFYLQAPGFMGGSVEKAKDVAKQIMLISPAEGHNQQGNIDVSEKQIAAAEKEYLEMVRIDAAYTPALAAFYANQKKYDKAYDLLEQRALKFPSDHLIVYQMGKLSAVTGVRLPRGEECLKKYLTFQPQKNEPTLAGADMRLGQVMERQGNKTEAKKCFEQAIKLDPSLKEAKEGLARVTE